MSPGHTPTSSDRGLSAVPVLRLRTRGEWAFAVVGPTFRNSLPQGSKNVVSRAVKKQHSFLCILYHNVFLPFSLLYHFIVCLFLVSASCVVFTVFVVWYFFISSLTLIYHFNFFFVLRCTEPCNSCFWKVLYECIIIIIAIFISTYIKALPNDQLQTNDQLLFRRVSSCLLHFI